MFYLLTCDFSTTTSAVATGIATPMAPKDYGDYNYDDSYINDHCHRRNGHSRSQQSEREPTTKERVS